MNPLDSALLADENVSPDVVAALRRRGADVATALELGLGGASDATLLRRLIVPRGPLLADVVRDLGAATVAECS